MARSSSSTWLRVTVGLALFLSVTLVAAPTAVAEDAPFLGWSSVFPALPGKFEPTSEEDCVAGRTPCVDKVIREMQRRFEPLADACDHDAIFELSYLRTTQEYRRTIEDPNFFEDTAFVNHEDVVFATYYFRAYEWWHSGSPSLTPRAWAIAFEAADNRAVSAAGNMVLGINAHINRDLPFTLAAIGLVKPDGSTRKTDHDRVNRFLNRIADDVVIEIARRFDPTADDGNLPTMVDDAITFQSVATWRETAWRNAERLVNAPTPLARSLVAADIEAYAATQALLLKQATAYLPGQTTAARDLYCAANHG